MELMKIFLTLFLIISCVKSQSDVKINDHANHTQNHPIRDYTNITRVENILTIFNIEHIGRNWIAVNDKLNKKCAHNMMQYLDGIQAKNTWAMKSKWMSVNNLIKLSKKIMFNVIKRIMSVMYHKKRK